MRAVCKNMQEQDGTSNLWCSSKESPRRRPLSRMMQWSSGSLDTLSWLPINCFATSEVRTCRYGTVGACLAFLTGPRFNIVHGFAGSCPLIADPLPGLSTPRGCPSPVSSLSLCSLLNVSMGMRTRHNSNSNGDIVRQNQTLQRDSKSIFVTSCFGCWYHYHETSWNHASLSLICLIKRSKHAHIWGPICI